ncbi:hypothetical protein H2O64_10195 [Kordia sp. YSTF-M3]|uniref:Uncharacterized protein n=1 Tax=Kordia aestuariivivens TaxID=2759037 RepID=A0ABR7Q929_9FLAO|nr:hypothetical protein [Kordia aestuariivivens]MBC8755043.1 hypothetical protein [Kordia aestuariivivens]
MTNSIANYKNSYLLCAFIFLFSININAQNSQSLYNAVQNIYSGYANISSSNCNAAKNMVAKLQNYTGNRAAVPAAKAYSVNFPKKVNNPTIGDLARDRIARIKSQFKSCFGSVSGNSGSLTLYNKVQNIYVGYTSIGSNNCNAAKNMVAKLQRYTSNRAAVPTSKAYSVNFPKKVNNPTIGDLARDRIARIKSQFKSCFGSGSGNSGSLTLYNKVQNIYVGYTSIGSNNCNAAKNMVAKLQLYTSNRAAVPTSKAYSVNFPKKVNNPTIGDLAKDRIARLKSQFKSCFERKGISNYILENHPGAWKYVHNGREYQFTIDRRGNTVVGSFKKHGYSYPPIYKGAKMMKNNRVRFRFELGGTHVVKLEFGHVSSGTFAYISQSWSENGKWVKLNLEPLTAKKPTPAPNAPLTKADITFLNQTQSNVVIYWVNGKGEEVKYKTLSPGNAHVQGTYSTHKWRVRLNGRVHLNYTTTKDTSQLVRIR